MSKDKKVEPFSILLMWQGMGKCYGKPKRARNWEWVDTAKGIPTLTRHSLTLR